MENLNEIQPKDLTEDQVFELRMSIVIKTGFTGLNMEVIGNDLIFYPNHMFQAEELKKIRGHKNAHINNGYILNYSEYND